MIPPWEGSRSLRTSPFRNALTLTHGFPPLGMGYLLLSKEVVHLNPYPPYIPELSANYKINYLESSSILASRGITVHTGPTPRFYILIHHISGIMQSFFYLLHSRKEKSGEKGAAHTGVVALLQRFSRLDQSVPKIL